MIERFSYPVFFLYTSLFSLLAFIFCFFSREGSFTVSKRSVFSGFFNVVFSERFRVLLLTNLIIAVGLGSMLNFFSVFLKENGISARSFFLTYAITVILIRVFGGKLPDIIERRKDSPAFNVYHGFVPAHDFFHKLHFECRFGLLCFQYRLRDSLSHYKRDDYRQGS